MNWLLTTYLSYLLISVALTVWVARTLHKNGRIFLVDSFMGNEQLADSVNHLLVVGFYLINIGYVTLALKYGAAAANPQEALESLSTKVGLVLLVASLACTPLNALLGLRFALKIRRDLGLGWRGAQRHR